MGKINKIVDALSVMNTGKREESISSIIKYTLFSLGQPITLTELIEFIALEYEINFNHSEIKEIVETLLKEGSLQIKNEKLVASKSVNEEIEKKQLESRSLKEKGFSQFQNSYRSICNSDVPFSDLKMLYDTFLEYINECFYVYGKSAIFFFKAHNTNEDQDIISRKKILNSALEKIGNNHKTNFEEYIKIFPTLLTKDEEVMLERLADKTEYFFALGLPKELFDEIQNINPINLDLYLDTNVLLSVLNLRQHTSNEACKKLIQLINENKESLNISVHYTNKTYNELQRTKNELDDLVDKIDIDPKIVKAGLKTDKLDSYTSSYYEEYIQFGTQVKHPTEKLKRAIEILLSQGVQIDRGEYKDIIESEGFKDELSSYNQFQKIKNEAREEKKLPLKREKDIFKIEHDVLVREIILKKRDTLNKEPSNDLISNKYYGLTLDKVLVDFDRFSLKRKYLNNDVFVPTFFSPSYLLKKLYKFLPIKSDDYRKAFISAISSPVFEDNRKTSNSFQNTLRDFHALGINDDKFIIKCLTNDYFLDEIKSKREKSFESLKEFVENELQKDYQEVLKEKEKKEELLNKVENKNSELVTEKSISQSENKILKEKEKNLKHDVENLQLSLKSIKKQLSKLEEQDTPQSSIQYNIEDKGQIESLKKEKGELKDQYEELKKGINEKEANMKLRKWKQVGWVSLGLSCCLLFVFLFAFILQNWEYNYIAQLLDWAESLKDLRKEIMKILLTALFGVSQYLFISVFYKRVLNKAIIDVKYKGILKSIELKD